MAAFMPEVPQASWGRRGVLSQTSTPLDQMPGNMHAVIFQKNDMVAHVVLTGEGDDIFDQLFTFIVGRVGLAGKYDLHRPLFVR